MDQTTTPERSKRNSVILRAQIHAGRAGGAFESRVRNLSETGVCIEHDGRLMPGVVVSIRLGKADDVDAEVMWSNERLAGLRFDQPVDVVQARRPRDMPSTTPSPSAAAGWMADMSDVYRRLR